MKSSIIERFQKYLDEGTELQKEIKSAQLEGNQEFLDGVKGKKEHIQDMIKFYGDMIEQWDK